MRKLLKRLLFGAAGIMAMVGLASPAAFAWSGNYGSYGDNNYSGYTRYASYNSYTRPRIYMSSYNDCDQDNGYSGYWGNSYWSPCSMSFTSHMNYQRHYNGSNYASYGNQNYGGAMSYATSGNGSAYASASAY